MGLFYHRKQLKVVGNMAGETGVSVPEKQCLQTLYFSLFPLAVFSSVFLWQFFSLLENDLVHCFSVPLTEQRNPASEGAH